MARLIGWQKETVEGTNPIVVGTAATEFGFVGDYKWNIAFPKRKTTLSFQENVRGQKGLTRGAKELEFTVPFSLKNAYPFVMAMGDVSHLAGVSTIELCAPADLPSYSIYQELGTKSYVSKGCKCKQLNLMIELGKAAKCELDFIGWDTVEFGPITADPPVIPPASSNADLKGWGNLESGVLTHGGDNQPGVTSVQLMIMNALDAEVGLKSPTPTGIQVFEGNGVMLNYAGVFKGSADDLFDKYYDGLVEDGIITLDLGGGNYYTINLHDVTFDNPVVIIEKEKVTHYTLSGWTLGDNIDVVVKDGHDYTSL